MEEGESMEDKMRIIGRRLRLIRMGRGYNQSEFAKLLGLSQTHLSNIENGKVSVTLVNLLRVAELLNCNMSEFFVDIEKQKLENQKTSESNSLSIEDLLKVANMLKEKEHKN